MQILEMVVNGAKRAMILEEGRVMLSDALRDGLGLTGTKVGCGAGQCGSCVVVMNGEAVTSCTTLASKAQGAEIVTIEGLARGGELHPIQEAFIEANAIQCGFCTPGLVMALYALFCKNPAPDDVILKKELNKHLCRCTGYEVIWDAAVLAREKMNGTRKACSE
ncbi:MAG: (2Fe-2S)-binding protein [Synergistaceae bacterium]|jgi:carbon-monoxide dehydrogenase small subunit|nr:(2Fe-2S)-binding protein [Synergistaceae bacterium]